MATSMFVDPLQMWRDAVTKLESEVNTMATGSTKYDDVVRALHQFSTVSLGMEQVLEKVIGGYLRRANLPSRKEVLELAESLRRIEDKVDRLLPADSTPAAQSPRPPRTRRPSFAAEAGAPVEAAASTDARPPTHASAPADARERDDATTDARAKAARTAKPNKTTTAKRRPVRRQGG